MTALGRTLTTRATRRPARRASQSPGVNAFWGLAYYLSAAPLVVTQGAQIAYIVIGAVWESDGRRPRALGSIFAPSPGWPPFSVPTLAFAGMAVVICAMAVEMAVRPAATPSGSPDRWQHSGRLGPSSCHSTCGASRQASPG